ncbi:MAG: thioredoxin-disulfide reductase [Candidatus Ratteibacteria bacterium]|nr:thioredoxin-disulfide reductase [Candidatus Ratteibacteria bacterium]
MYDVIIIGGGPAGLTAGIYTSRDRLKTLILEKSMCGGLVATADFIENYPGFTDGIKGTELMANFKKQAEKFGTGIKELKEIKNIKRENGKITVLTEKEEYSSRALVIASGSMPKTLNVPGEKELRGKGVSYCAICDGPFFKDKDIAVVGCGNSGLQEGEALLKFAKSITFIEFLPFITAARILQERLQKNKKASFLLNHMLVSINGKNKVDSVTVKDRQTNQKKTIAVAGVFMYVGFLPNSGFLKGIVDLDKHGYIKTDEKMRTSVPGIYAVGDVRCKEVRQIDVACGEATIAAISIRDYLQELSK